MSMGEFHSTRCAEVKFKKLVILLKNLLQNINFLLRLNTLTTSALTQLESLILQKLILCTTQ